MVVAPSDVSSIWEAMGGVQCGKPKGPGCTCESGHNCPSCKGSDSVCGKKIQIWCEDATNKYCKGGSIVVTVNNACPSTHPCNIKNHHCVGSDSEHLDIGDTAYYKLASGQPGGSGLPISYSLVDDSTQVGAYGVNDVMTWSPFHNVTGAKIVKWTGPAPVPRFMAN
jgi:hypothetical protein